MAEVRTLAVLALAATAACTLAPRYQRPAAPVPSAFPAAGAAGARPAGDLGWREVIVDARLQALVGLALERNRNLKATALNVELVRAQYRIQRAQLMPAVVAGATFSQARTPGDLNSTGKPLTADSWTVNGAVTGFELDLFGRVLSLSSAALEQYLSTDEARRSAQLALVGDVATQDLALRAATEQVALARSTQEAQAASLAITRRQAEAGRASELDLRTAESQAETARFNLAVAEAQRDRAEHALAVLVGGPLPADLPAPAPLDSPALLTELPAGVPSEVLTRRPDVLAAEHALRAANAQIGAARAAFLPTLSLTGSFGTASADLNGLFQPNSEAWTFIPRITLPIFAGGANRANLDVAEVRKSIQVVQYERAIEVAFREVADALTSRGWLDQQLAAQTARVAAERRRYELSEKRYNAGIDPYLTFLTAQRDLYAAQQGLIQARLARLTNLLDLYRALGGGWSEKTVTASAG
ncbi:MAG: efflux transporter outer membrane subunit [Anaeromyxobacteraceae bacterium]